MNRALVIVMDLGKFRAFRMEKDHAVSTPRLVQIENRESSVENHLSNQLTDHFGQFGKGSRGPDAVGGSGERHNIDLEFRRRAVKEFARLAGQMMEREGADTIYFAAGGEINQQMLDAMDARLRARIGKNVRANLTNLNAAAIVGRFQEHAPA